MVEEVEMRYRVDMTILVHELSSLSVVRVQQIFFGGEDNPVLCCLVPAGTIMAGPCILYVH